MRLTTLLVAAGAVLSGTSGFTHSPGRPGGLHSIMSSGASRSVGFGHTRASSLRRPRHARRSAPPQMMFEHLATVVEHHAAIEQLAAAGVHQPTALNAIVGGAAQCGGDLLAAYKHSLATRFQATTCIQSFVLVGLGDAIAQMIKGGGAGYDARRTAKMAALGLLVSGFGTSNWLMFLESQLPGHAQWQTVVEKASLDAGIWAPAANTAYLFFVPLLDGASTNDAVEAVQKDFLPVMRTEISTFLPYNLVSFALIPPQFRPFTTGFVSMCFAIYLSWVCNAAKDGDKAAAVVGAEEL